MEQEIRHVALNAKAQFSNQHTRTAILKATSPLETPPKPKHLRYLIRYLNSGGYIAKVEMILRERTNENNWIVVFKALEVYHTLIREENLGESFLQILSMRPTSFNHLNNFLDKRDTKGYEMSKLIRRYANYLEERIAVFRIQKIDFLNESKRSKNCSMFPALTNSELIQILEALQGQVEILLQIDIRHEFISFVVRGCYLLLMRDLTKLYVTLNEAIIILLDRFFKMNLETAKKSYEIYNRFVEESGSITHFFEVGKRLDHSSKNEIPDLKAAPITLLKVLEDHIKLNNGNTFKSDFHENQKKIELVNSNQHDNALVMKTALTNLKSNASEFSNSLKNNKDELLICLDDEEDYQQGKTSFDPFLETNAKSNELLSNQFSNNFSKNDYFEDVKPIITDPFQTAFDHQSTNQDFFSEKQNPFSTNDQSNHPLNKNTFSNSWSDLKNQSNHEIFFSEKETNTSQNLWDSGKSMTNLANFDCNPSHYNGLNRNETWMTNTSNFDVNSNYFLNNHSSNQNFTETSNFTNSRNEIPKYSNASNWSSSLQQKSIFDVDSSSKNKDPFSEFGLDQILSNSKNEKQDFSSNNKNPFL